MEGAREFTHAQVMARLLESLDLEIDPAKREALQDHLLREEDQLGQTRGKRDQIEEFIRRGRKRIQLQQGVVDRLDPGDGDRAAAAALLQELLRTPHLFEARRAMLLQKLDAGA